jgi:hypothetical protein
MRSWQEGGATKMQQRRKLIALLYSPSGINVATNHDVKATKI